MFLFFIGGAMLCFTGHVSDAMYLYLASGICAAGLEISISIINAATTLSKNEELKQTEKALKTFQLLNMLNKKDKKDKDE